MKKILYPVFFSLLFAFPLSAFADYNIPTLGTPGGNAGWGTSGTTWIAQSFLTTNGTDILSSVDTFQLINAGTGNDYYLTLEANSGGIPSGTPLDTSSTVSNNNSCSAASTATFTGAYPLSNATTYWLVYHMIGTPDDTNNNEGCGDTDTYGGGTQLRYVGAWSDQSIDEKLTAYFTAPGGGGGGGGGSTTTIATEVPLHFETVQGVFFILALAMAIYWAFVTIRYLKDC